MARRTLTRSALPAVRFVCYAAVENPKEEVKCGERSCEKADIRPHRKHQCRMLLNYIHPSSSPMGTATAIRIVPKPPQVVGTVRSTVVGHRRQPIFLGDLPKQGVLAEVEKYDDRSNLLLPCR